MSVAARTRELLLALVQNIIDVDSRDELMKHENLQALFSSLESATRSVVVAQNELSLINKLPPETLATISEFAAGPRTRESMFELVKVTHVCQYWRSTLISCPHLWSSIFVKSDHRDFIAACLERSREVPLAVHMDLEYGAYHYHSDCRCKQGRPVAATDPHLCRYHSTFVPLVTSDCTRRIHKLDIHLHLLDTQTDDSDWYFEGAFDHFKLFELPLPTLECLNLRIHSALASEILVELPRDLFCWDFSPPTELRHFTLHGCYGDAIRAVCNLTSLELSGWGYHRTELSQRTFLPLISNSPSLQTICLSHFSFPGRAQLSLVSPVKLSELKFLQLMDIHGLPGFSCLVEVPAFKTISSIWISARDPGSHFDSDRFLIRAEGDDGFQLSYDTSSDSEVMSDWLDIMRDADPSPSLVRFEGEVAQRGNGMRVSPFPLFVNATILEVGASFVKPWYRDFWKDVEKVGPQLTTLRLEVVEGMDPAVAKSMKRLAKARFQRGMPLTKLERMKFEGVSEEDDVKAKKLWEEFRDGLGVDQYLTTL